MVQGAREFWLGQIKYMPIRKANPAQGHFRFLRVLFMKNLDCGHFTV
jgi:hypothetical protein